MALWLLEKAFFVMVYIYGFYRFYNMFVNPGRIRPWGWLLLLNYLSEPALAMALMVKHRHTGTCTGTNTFQAPGAAGKSVKRTVVRVLGPTCSNRHASLGLGRDGGRAVSYPTHQESQFQFQRKILSSGFCTLLFSTDPRTVSMLYQDIPHKLQASPIMQLQGHKCQGVALWYNHLSSSFVSFYCAITRELVSHFWAMTLFPFTLWYWNITNYNNILIFGSSCFYNTYLYFPSYYIFEIEMSSQCWCPTWYVTKDNIEFLILLSSSSECWGYGVCHYA